MMHICKCVCLCHLNMCLYVELCMHFRMSFLLFFCEFCKMTNLSFKIVVRDVAGFVILLLFNVYSQGNRLRASLKKIPFYRECS